MYLSLLIAIFAVVLNRYLIEDEGILEFYGRLIDRLPDYLNYPLGRCSYCFAGQVALWVYIIKYIITVDFGTDYLMIILYITLTIFLTHIIAFIWDIIERLWKT